MVIHRSSTPRLNAEGSRLSLVFRLGLTGFLGLLDLRAASLPPHKGSARSSSASASKQEQHGERGGDEEVDAVARSDVGLKTIAGVSEPCRD